MKAPHLLRVGLPPERFAALFAALKTLGLRCGWLELAAETPEPVPESLASAAGLGALRAVSVGSGRSVAVKPLRGAAVIPDLLREHFQGCTVVLVLGEGGGPLGPLPELDPETDPETGAEVWRVAPPDVATRSYSTQGLAEALRRPHPWPAEG